MNKRKQHSNDTEEMCKKYTGEIKERHELEAILNSGKTFEDRGHIELAIENYEKALILGEKLNDKDQITSVCMLLGNCYNLTKKVHKAIESSEKALKIAKEKGDKLQEADAYFVLGNTCTIKNQYEKAIEYHEKGLDIAKKQADKRRETEAYIGLGLAYSFNNQYKTAIEYYEKALEIAKKRADKGQETEACIALGDIFRFIDVYPKAIEYFEKALEISTKRADKERARKAYIGLADSYASCNDCKKAIECYEKALEIDKQGSGVDSQINILLNISKIHYLNEQNEMGFNSWEKASKLAEEEGDEELKAKILKDLEKFKKREDHTFLTGNIDSLEPCKWKENSKVHREKFKKLLEFRKQHPNEIKVINGVRVCCSKDFLIGKGADGTRVYVGLGKDGLERAVKRLPKDVCTPVAEQEMKILTQNNTIDSNNVVKYWFLDESSDKENLFLILDLCEETLESYVNRESADDLDTVAPEIIQQILKGLADLHRDPNPILHRDLKPSNILRDVNGKWLLADFGISRVMETDKTTHESGQRGTKHWRAVETYPSNDTSNDCQVRYKKQSDIQVAGMVAYYIVTKGEHPFGKERDLLSNLLDGKPVGLEKLKDPALKDLLTWMLSHDPKDRPSAEEALKHPYLQTKEHQFELLCNMGNQPEIKKGDVSSFVVQQLNSDSADWQTLMDADVLKYLCTGFSRGKPTTFKYASSWTECLRLIRNVNQHWKDQPRPKPQPEPFYVVGDPREYFLKVFPHLPVTVHRVVRSCDWKERPELQKFFN